MQLSVMKSVALGLALALGIAACGDDSTTVEPSSTDAPEAEGTAAPPDTDPPANDPPTTDPPGDLPVEIVVTEAVPYTSARSLDVYAPAEGSGMPVVVYFHGGPPAPGRRTVREPLLRDIAEQGVVVYAPDWRSNGPSGGSPDTTCAVAFAESAAAEHGGDPDAVTLAGFSTGAFTALVQAFTVGEPPVPVDDCAVDPAPAPAGAVAVGGAPVFAAEWARDGKLPNPSFTDLTPEQLDAVDPFLLIGQNPDLVVSLMVGEDDRGGPGAPPQGWPIIESNLEYHQALVDAGYDATLTVVPGGHELEPGTEQHDTFARTIVEAAATTIG